MTSSEADKSANIKVRTINLRFKNLTMSSDNNNTTASFGTSTNIIKVADGDAMNSTATASTLEVQTISSDATKISATTSAVEVNATNTLSTLSTLSLTDTTIYTTYSLAQLDAWITAYHEESALVCNKIRPLTTFETAILEKLLTQRRGVENSMIHKMKYEEFMAGEKAKRRDEGN